MGAAGDFLLAQTHSIIVKELLFLNTNTHNTNTHFCTLVQYAAMECENSTENDNPPRSLQQTIIKCISFTLSYIIIPKYPNVRTDTPDLTRTHVDKHIL